MSVISEETASTSDSSMQIKQMFRLYVFHLYEGFIWLIYILFNVIDLR